MDVYEKLKQALPQGEVLINEPLRLHTTFAIGGPATFAIPADVKELSALLQTIDQLKEKPFIMGLGSNLLISDEGMDEIVISTERLKNICIIGNMVKAEAGVAMKDLCEMVAAHGLSGLEFACGIPGSVGGAIYMNAGAYEGEIKNTVISVDVMDMQGRLEKRMAKEMHFGYRDSCLKHEDGVCVSATFLLQQDDKKQIRQRMEDYTNQRSARQPLEDHSAGSTFKRPPGYFAGPLIIESGMQGKKIGGARVSEKHAGFIVSDGTATARDVLTLIQAVKDAVKDHAGVTLECEVRMVGKPLKTEDE